ncbi:hypothetical protein ACQZ42_32005 [Rhizobium rhizogenes]
MTEQSISWEQAINSGWFFAKNVGSVRSSSSYRPGGWWFLPKWLPDTEENDVGPFKTKTAALAEAERLAAISSQNRRQLLSAVAAEQRLPSIYLGDKSIVVTTSHESGSAK